MDDPGDDSEWPFEGTESSPSTRRGWPWVIGLILIVMLICGAGVLALNAFVGRELDKAAAQAGGDSASRRTITAV